MSETRSLVIYLICAWQRALIEGRPNEGIRLASEANRNAVVMSIQLNSARQSTPPGLAHTPAKTYRADASGEKLACALQSGRPRFSQDILSALIAMARVGAFGGWCPLTSGAAVSARRPHLINNS